MISFVLAWKAVYAIEGLNIPSVDHLYALSRLFHVSIDDMLEGITVVLDEGGSDKTERFVRE